jgi:hypothetical protein
VNVTHLLPFTAVYRCNLLEDRQERIPSQAGSFAFDIGPFRVCTFRLRRSVRKRTRTG